MSAIRRAKEQGYRDGYEAARVEAVRRVSEMLVRYSDEMLLWGRDVRIDTLVHVRAYLRAMRSPTPPQVPEPPGGVE